MRRPNSTLLMRLGLVGAACAGVAAVVPASQAAHSSNVALSKGSTQSAFVATPLKTNKTLNEPQNRRAHYSGPSVVLQSSYIGRESGEPTVGVDKKGTIFFPGDTFDTPGPTLGGKSQRFLRPGLNLPGSQPSVGVPAVEQPEDYPSPRPRPDAGEPLE